MKKPINETERLKLIAGLINEVEYNDSVYGIKRNVLTEGKKEVKELHIDVANPYEYRHGLQYELEQIGEYTDEALEKAKSTVLKNLAKDVNFYSNLLNQEQSPFKFKESETDKPGMQAKADGHLKKELKKDEKANVQDSLGKKEAGKKKPKGIKIMPDKGVTGSEKTIKEGLEEVKGNKYIDVDNDGEYQLNDKAVAAYLKSVISPEEIESVDYFMNDDEGYGESSMYFFDVDDDVNKMPTEKEVEDWAKQEVSYYLFSKPDEFPGKEGVAEHHNDPNFPGGTKIHAMLDKVADEWGKDSDVYNDLEDAIVGWADRNGELSPKGKIAIKALLSNWDMLDDYEQFLSETVEEATPGEESNPEDQFKQLMSKYDWYYEMSDDPRTYDRGIALDRQLRTLGKQIGVDKAVELFNQYAPSDRKETSLFFQMKEDKYSKIKETLKQALKKEILNPKDIQAAKKTGDIVNIPSQDTAAQTQAKNAKLNFRTYQA